MSEKNSNFKVSSTGSLNRSNSRSLSNSKCSLNRSKQSLTSNEPNLATSRNSSCSKLIRSNNSSNSKLIESSSSSMERNSTNSRENERALNFGSQQSLNKRNQQNISKNSSALSLRDSKISINSIKLKQFVALRDYRGDSDETLNFFEGDVFLLLDATNEDWWYVQLFNNPAMKGYVPRTFLKAKHSKEGEGSISDELENGNKVGRNEDVEVQNDFSNEEGSSKAENERIVEEEEDNKEEDDDEEENEEEEEEVEEEEEEEEEEEDYYNEDGDVNEDDCSAVVDFDEKLVDSYSSTYLQEKNLAKRKKILKVLENENDNLQKNKTKKIFSLPPGYKHSFLSGQYEQVENKLSYTLFPQFDNSGIGFKDLFFDDKHQKIRKRPSKCVVAFSILDARNIEVKKIPGYEIIGRNLKMCLFDKTQVLSNIHSLEAVYNPINLNKWKFSNKTSLLFPKDDENTCFIRTNDIDINLCVLFELSILVKKSSPLENGDKNVSSVELGNGWGVLPLFTSDGGPIENKSYNIKLYNGNPFDKNVGENPAIEESKGFLKSMLGGNSNPNLEIRVWKLGKASLKHINQLPDTCISFLSVVPLLAFYRNILATTLYSTHIEGKIFSFTDSSLSLLPRICDSNPMLKLTFQIFDKKIKLLKRSERNSYTILKEKFTESVLIVWPLLNFHSFSASSINIELFKMNAVEKLQEEGAINFLTKNVENTYFSPFDTSEVQF
ncbi:Nephrocystin-1, partial [Lobulomyces angularis]